MGYFSPDTGTYLISCRQGSINKLSTNDKHAAVFFADGTQKEQDIFQLQVAPSLYAELTVYR